MKNSTLAIAFALIFSCTSSYATSSTNNSPKGCALVLSAAYVAEVIRDSDSAETAVSGDYYVPEARIELSQMNSIYVILRKADAEFTDPLEKVFIESTMSTLRQKFTAVKENPNPYYSEIISFHAGLSSDLFKFHNTACR